MTDTSKLRTTSSEATLKDAELKSNTKPKRPPKEVFCKWLENANIPKCYWGLKKADLRPPYDEALGGVLEDMLGFLKAGKSILIFGKTGTGKSTASAVIAKYALLQTRRVLWIRSKELVQASIDGREYDAYQTIEEIAPNRALLVIDDFGREYRGSGSGYAETYLENLVRGRVAEMKSTVITTNLAPGKIKKVYGEGFFSILHQDWGHVSTVNRTDERVKKHLAGLQDVEEPSSGTKRRKTI